MDEHWAPRQCKYSFLFQRSAGSCRSPGLLWEKLIGTGAACDRGLESAEPAGRGPRLTPPLCSPRSQEHFWESASGARHTVLVKNGREAGRAGEGRSQIRRPDLGLDCFGALGRVCDSHNSGLVCYSWVETSHPEDKTSRFFTPYLWSTRKCFSGGLHENQNLFSFFVDLNSFLYI